jgi:hypothetical protein
MELTVDHMPEDLPLHVAEAQDVRQCTMEAMKVLHLAATGSYPSHCLLSTPCKQITLARDNSSQLEQYLWSQIFLPISSKRRHPPLVYDIYSASTVSSTLFD